MILISWHEKKRSLNSYHHHHHRSTFTWAPRRGTLHVTPGICLESPISGIRRGKSQVESWDISLMIFFLPVPPPFYPSFIPFLPPLSPSRRLPRSFLFSSSLPLSFFLPFSPSPQRRPPPSRDFFLSRSFLFFSLLQFPSDLPLDSPDIVSTVDELGLCWGGLKRDSTQIR